MLAIGFGLAWLGYAIGYYGWNRITGGNDTFKSLVWPGAYQPTPRDGGGASSPAPAPVGSTTPTASVPGTNPAGPGYSAAGGGTGAIHP